MPLTVAGLSSAIVSGFPGNDAAKMQDFANKLAAALVPHLIANIVVTVTVATTGTAAAQTGTGTGTIS